MPSLLSQKNMITITTRPNTLTLTEQRQIQIKTLCKRDPRIWSQAIYLLKKSHHFRILRSLQKNDNWLDMFKPTIVPRLILCKKLRKKVIAQLYRVFLGKRQDTQAQFGDTRWQLKGKYDSNCIHQITIQVNTSLRYKPRCHSKASPISGGLNRTEIGYSFLYQSGRRQPCPKSSLNVSGSVHHVAQGFSNVLVSESFYTENY